MKSKFLLATLFCSSSLFADEIPRFDVPMQNQGASTFYVQSTIQGSEECMMLVDTGSGHSVINEVTLESLKASGDASFIKNLKGMMADGSTKIVPLYRISAITIGESCVIRDVEAAVLPNNARQILGISTLQRAAPFGLSFDPPTLSLSGCETATVVQAATDDVAPEIALEPAAAPKGESTAPVKTEQVATNAS